MKSLFKRINLFLVSFFSPCFFFVISIISLSLCVYGYSFTKNVKYVYVFLFFLFLLFLNFSFVYAYLKDRLRLESISFLKGKLWIYFGLLIIGVNFLEYIVCGTPIMFLLGKSGFISYSTYGLPLLHHIAVESWLLIFIKSKSKVMNFCFFLFALINPIVIMNRDLLLLTFFSFIFSFLLKNLKSSVPLLLIFLVVIGFSYMGKMRSGDALANTLLPIKSEFVKGNFIIQWVYVYVTSSWYNFLNNMGDKSYVLEFSNINVFPEAYSFFVRFDIVGFIFFYLVCFCVLIFFLHESQKKKDFQILYIYFLYQSFMTIFGVKFFTTNSIFQVLLFYLVFIIRKNKSKFLL